MKTRRPHPAAPRPADPLQQLCTTTYRVTRADWLALKRAAEERTLSSGERPDASAVLREVLRAWREKQPASSATPRRKP